MEGSRWRKPPGRIPRDSPRRGGRIPSPPNEAGATGTLAFPGNEEGLLGHFCEDYGVFPIEQYAIAAGGD